MHTHTLALTHTHTLSHTHSYTHPHSLTLSHTQFDADKNGHITAAEIGAVMKALGEVVPGYKIRDMIKEVDIDENGTVEFDEFVEVRWMVLCSDIALA